MPTTIRGISQSSMVPIWIKGRVCARGDRRNWLSVRRQSIRFEGWAMDWVLGMVAVFCYAAGLNTIAFAVLGTALIISFGTIALRLRARAQGSFPDNNWIAPKLFTALVLSAAIWCLAAQTGLYQSGG